MYLGTFGVRSGGDVGRSAGYAKGPSPNNSTIHLVVWRCPLAGEAGGLDVECRHVFSADSVVQARALKGRPMHLHADSDEGGHLFQTDGGHHSRLMAARVASSHRSVLVIS